MSASRGPTRITNGVYGYTKNKRQVVFMFGIYVCQTNVLSEITYISYLLRIFYGRNAVDAPLIVVVVIVFINRLITYFETSNQRLLITELIYGNPRVQVH